MGASWLPIAHWKCFLPDGLLSKPFLMPGIEVYEDIGNGHGHVIFLHTMKLKILKYLQFLNSS